ncbi:hypothetical protein [Pseudomonas sp. RIT-PI-AD]|uniref:hypothetical protein n=1 Tax=Pseudomonas sp. RIT-PI-AD TaxID=3035294 RepID=UPI0021DB12CA|nr:hypothetical protein [Pseudomonas sp. RIT-PI-AD]
MAGWWVIISLGIALSPLAWLLPSRRQRGRMDMRLRARRLGLAMQLSPENWPHWLERPLPVSCPQYHRARPHGRTDAWCYWQAQPGEWLDRWREPCSDPRLAEHLARLPADVYKVEATPRMIALCWGEGGDEAELEQVRAALQALA